MQDVADSAAYLSRQLPLCHQVDLRQLQALLHVLLLLLIVSSLSEFGKMHMAPSLTALCCACKTSLSWHDTYQYIVINWMVIQHAARKRERLQCFGQPTSLITYVKGPDHIFSFQPALCKGRPHGVKQVSNAGGVVEVC